MFASASSASATCGPASRASRLRPIAGDRDQAGAPRASQVSGDRRRRDAHPHRQRTRRAAAARRAAPRASARGCGRRARRRRRRGRSCRSGYARHVSVNAEASRAYRRVHAARRPAYTVPDPGPAGPYGTMAWLRATVSRFANGETHARRRALVEALLADLDPADLRDAAARRCATNASLIVLCTTNLALVPRARCRSTPPYVPVTVCSRARSASQRAISPTPSPPPDSSPPPTTRTRTRPEPTLRSRGSSRCSPAAIPRSSRSGSRCSSRHARRRPGSSGGMICRCPSPAASDPRGEHRRSSTSPGGRSAPALAAVPAKRTRSRARRRGAGAMSAFADLHRPGDPLVLPNAWDHASAAALAEAGFAAVGTTSLGVAAALGLRDGAAETAQATIDLAHRLTHLPVPVTMDIENGFSTDPAEVAAYVDRLGPGRRRQPRGPARRHGRLRPGARRGHRPRTSSSTPASTPTGSATGASTRRSNARRPTSPRARTGSSSRASRTRRRSRAWPRRSPSRSTSSSSPARPTSPGSPSSASPASARARCSTASRSAPPSTPRRPSATAAPQLRSPVLRDGRRAQSIVRTSLPRTWPASSCSWAAAACSSGKVAAMCGRRPPAATSGVMCSPRS